MEFRAAAGRLAGLAGAVLGWRPDEFWRATPAELGAVLGAMAGEAMTPPPPAPGERAKLMEMFPDG